MGNDRWISPSGEKRPTHFCYYSGKGGARIRRSEDAFENRDGTAREGSTTPEESAAEGGSAGTSKALCRDCLLRLPPLPAGGRCPRCNSPRLLQHAELDRLTLAHVDCDAFYASVEKRDDPALADRPVIVGGGQRGVVTTCCYIARLYGVRSAMPMFKALKACPDAVVIKPDMARYRQVGRDVRALLLETTPQVQSVSIDEAYLDLAGTALLHRRTPAETLAALAQRVERELGITLSIGLSYNKFLAKLASDLDKPRGFRVVGRADALALIAPLSVRAISGVGPALGNHLVADGWRTIGDLRRAGEAALVGRHGKVGQRLWHYAHGEDARAVETASIAKSISAETTFRTDIADREALERQLWPLCERVAVQLRQKGRAAGQVTLKLKDRRFRSITRARQLVHPTQLAETLFRTGCLLLADAPAETYRLIGIGGGALTDPGAADPPDLFADAPVERDRRTAAAIEAVRERVGDVAIKRGRDLTVKE